jgi:hypothetical protein
LINTNENWIGVGVMNDEEAKEIFLRKYFSLVLLGSEFKKKVKLNCALFQKSKSRYQYSTTLWRREWFAKSEILLALENIKILNH